MQLFPSRVRLLKLIEKLLDSLSYSKSSIKFSLFVFRGIMPCIEAKLGPANFIFSIVMPLFRFPNEFAVIVIFI